MKVVITENKLTNSIYNYIDETFNPNNMDWVYGMDDGEDGDLVEFAKLMDVHWQHKKKRSNNMSNSKINEW